MPDISFVTDGLARFPTKYHGEVSLSERKWNDICNKPERQYYRYNGDKVATTLITPDRVRYHGHQKDQFFYYKRFDAIKISEGVSMTRDIFMAVVIDDATKRICTIYPVEEPKPGKEYKPGGQV